MTQSLYCWQELGSDGRWGNITAIIPFLPQMGATLLVARDYIAMAMLRPIAEQHHQRTGNPVRLARYDEAETLVMIPGGVQ